MTKSSKWQQLPANWEVGTAANGKSFYVDHDNKKTTWLDPRFLTPTGKSSELTKRTQKSSDGTNKEDLLPVGWEKAFTSDGVTYYIDHINQTTASELPPKYHTDITKSALINNAPIELKPRKVAEDSPIPLAFLIFAIILFAMYLSAEPSTQMVLKRQIAKFLSPLVEWVEATLAN